MLSRLHEFLNEHSEDFTLEDHTDLLKSYLSTLIVPEALDEYIDPKTKKYIVVNGTLFMSVDEEFFSRIAIRAYVGTVTWNQELMIAFTLHEGVTCSTKELMELIGDNILANDISTH